MREFEPFRIKMVEPIRRTTRAERERLIETTGHNLFALRADDVMVDLLTDSGTGAMSVSQWAALMMGDESYAGSRSYFDLAESVRDIFGFEHVVPTHQGRAAEHLFFGHLLTSESIVVSNGHFDTTRAHVELTGARALDMPCAESADVSAPAPFKGNIDLDALSALLDGPNGDRVTCVVMTVTNNTGGGQPVSLENLRAASRLAHDANVPLVLDAARIAENAWLVREREAGQQSRTAAEIVRDLADCADVLLMSAKKDGLVNIGGLVCVRDAELFERMKERSIVFEGYPTYGGMSGRDLAALAQGLREVVDHDYLDYRTSQVALFADGLRDAGVPIMQPAGGHAVYVDASTMLAHVPQDQFPAQALACALYVEGGVRGVEVGSNMAGRDPETGENRHPPVELLRLAVPRRTYTHTQLDHAVQALHRIALAPERVSGLTMTYEPRVLRHFTARFELTSHASSV